MKNKKKINTKKITKKNISNLKKGDKLVCVDNDGMYSILTVGKKYTFNYYRKNDLSGILIYVKEHDFAIYYKRFELCIKEKKEITLEVSNRLDTIE